MTSISTPNPEEQTSPSKVSNSPVYISPSISTKPGPERGNSTEHLCPPVSPPLRRSERNIPSDSPTKPSGTPKASPQSSQPPLPAIPPVPRMKRKHSDTEPVSLSPPSRKRRRGLDSDEIATPPTSPTKHGMCLRNSPKSPLVKELTPKSLKNETPEPFKTPRKPLLIPKISRKRVRLEFREPDPATFTSLAELFDYDEIITRKPRIPKLPRLPRITPTSTEDITPLHHLICREKYL